MKHNLYDMIQQKQGSSHDCTDNTTSTTRHHKGAKPTQGLRKILAILMLMTISISAWATDYVFVYNGNYLGIDANGNLTNYTSFQGPACVWTCVYNNAVSTLDNTTNKSLRITYNGNTRYLYTEGGNGTAIEARQTPFDEWQLRDNNRLTRRTDNNNRYAYYYNGAWRTSRSTGYNEDRYNAGGADRRPTVYVTTTTPHEATGAITLQLTQVPEEVIWQQGGKSFNPGANANTNYVRAYTTYRFDNNDHNWYDGSDHNYGTPAINNFNDFTPVWTVETGSSHLTYTSATPSIYTSEFKYDPPSETDVTATIKLTLTHNSFPEITASATANTILRAVPSYSINITTSPVGAGTFTTSTLRAFQGSSVTYTSNPAPGYELSSVEIRNAATNERIWPNNNTFTMPGSNVNIAATFAEHNYTINLRQNTGGTISSTPTSATIGTQVNLRADVNEGYTFDSWIVKDAANQVVPVSNNTFTMPPSDVTVEASFSNIVYDVTVIPAANGTISASPTSATVNTQVLLTSLPLEGYVLESWNVKRTDNNQNVIVTNNAFTMPASNVTVTATFNLDYSQPVYFYNEEQGVFLSRGGQYGTRCVADNIGIPFKISSTTNSSLVSFDWGTNGLGTNLVTNNEDPCTWTFSGNNEDGYTLYNNVAGGYLMASTAHTNITTNGNVANASKWKILNKQQYDIIREAKVAANATAVATRAGLSSIDEIYTYNYLPVDKTSSVRSASLINSNQGWTSTASPNRNFNVTTNAYGTEVYQGSGVLSQTVTGLQEGVYKVRMLGYFRDGTNADDWSYAQAGYPISVMYLAANGEEARFPNRSEQGEAQGNPNSMAEFRTLANQGRYVAELYTYVGADGRLELSVNIPSYKATCWAIFSDLTLTYYENQMSGYTLVHNGSQITNMAGKYLLADDFVPGDNPIGTATTPFTGTVDGQFNVIGGLTHPLFDRVNNATIKNIIVDNVSINVTENNSNVGAIVNEARGDSRIYNCGVLATSTTVLQKGHSKDIYNKTFTSSSTIQGTAAVGSIVGEIQGNTRVVNCYSYADVKGGTYAAGIVGRYNGTWVGSAANTTGGANMFVMNNMFYGNVVSGTNRSPIVYGNAITGNYSTWSYFRYKSITNTNFTQQNGAMAAQEDMWLKRFNFYQSAVTNHRDMAAVYIFNDASRINEIAQWYIDENIAPWPILRKAGPQKSILERVIPNTGRANEGNLITNGKILVDEEGNTLDNDVTQRYNMNVGTGGYLTVNFSINGSSYSKRLPITDMDHEHYDYTWGKVVLPFANEFEGWTRNYDYICTGWEISSVTGGTTGTLTDYNFADRNCTAKDIYDATNNPIIFAQGGNWIVPYGVTSINVKAHFAKAYYLADANYDCRGGGTNGFGGARPTTYHGRTVYTSVANAWNAMENRVLPHDQALVLVGNYHYNANTSGTYTNKGCTIMSIDEDNDQQPDFGWYNSNGNYRANWMPMRWDFIALYGFNMVQTNTAPPGIAIPNTKGWMEFTETTICRTYEFESNDGNRSGNDDGHSRNAWIINGGYYQQMVRCYNSNEANKLSYMKVGGNAYIKEFFHGNHSGTFLKFTLRPIIVTGGEIEQCFMTGMGNKDEITATNNNVRFYCAGGKIDKYISAYNGYPVVNATMKVDHARIGRFFGGGTSPKAALSGNINITMDNSYVDFFCGGPEFGDMGNGKTVTVNTKGSIFGEYYGAGFGGTALTRITNGDNKKGPFNTNNGTRARLSYNANEGGFEVSYEMEAILSGDGNSLWRYYDYRADLSMASTGNVTTTAEDCLFLNNFYGGGCQGTVNGNTNSTLTNCDVRGSAFGGGYKAAATVINVLPAGGNTWQVWDGTYKAYSDPVYPAAVEFTWIHTNGDPAASEANKTLSTKADLTNLGTVTGNATMSIDGGVVYGDVFGAGHASKVATNTDLTVKDCRVYRCIFGGGRQAVTGGNTDVKVKGNTVVGTYDSVTKKLQSYITVQEDGQNVQMPTGNVYGGGNAGEVGGNTNVTIGE